jgi:hypothetical protein
MHAAVGLKCPTRSKKNNDFEFCILVAGGAYPETQN